jgi:hypothetical protein
LACSKASAPSLQQDPILAQLVCSFVPCLVIPCSNPAGGNNIPPFFDFFPVLTGGPGQSVSVSAQVRASGSPAQYPVGEKNHPRSTCFSEISRFYASLL